jgi:SAM-dependent methyltransferase
MKRFIRFLVRTIPRPILIRFSGLFSFLIRPFYAGNKVFCPVCESSFRKFLPFGNKGEINRLCPKCLSLERHRLLWLYLKNETDFFSSKYKLMHIAPEQPFLKRLKNLKNLDYTTADLVSPIADMHFDVMNIPLDDNIYDYVICNHVLEHVEDDIHAMRELRRILKPRGKAILQVPINYEYQTTHEDKSVTDPKEREKVFGQYDHVRFHGLDYPERLKQAGFDIIEFDIKTKLNQDEMERFRLDKREILFISVKK